MNSASTTAGTSPRDPAPSPVSAPALLLLSLAAAVTMLAWSPQLALRLLPACPVHQYLHLVCPGCGSTHALLRLLHGDLPGAWHANPLFLLLSPLALAYLGVAARRSLARDPQPWPRLPAPATATLLAAAAFFSIARNL